MMKRLTAGILCALLLFTVFASCKKQEHAEVVTNNSLIFDVYDAAYSYDESTVSAYADLCEAVYNGENSVRFNVGMLDGVLQLFYTSYPLSALVKDIAMNTDGSGVTVTYTKSADEVRTDAMAFSDKIGAILTACKSGKVPERAFVINVYNYTATHMKNSDADGLTAYSAIMTGEGDSFTASNMFEYLLRQGGVKSYHILATDVSGAGWGISMAEIDGENYLFDTMTEQLANGGAQLGYFGMTNDDAKAEGLKTFVYTSRMDAPVCDNPYFDACRDSIEWKFGENEQSILVTQNDGEIVEIAL